MAKKKSTTKRKLIGKPMKQTGSSDKASDKRVSALKPGKRVSATGKVYTETRANRSDKGKKI